MSDDRPQIQLASGLSPLINYFIDSLQPTLRRTVVRDHEQAFQAINLLRLTMNAGNGITTRALLDEIGARSNLSEMEKQELFAPVVDFASLTLSLVRDTIPSSDLESATNISNRIASILAEIGSPDMAYNVYEIAYNFSDALGHPSFPAAKGLLKFSNPDKEEQLHSAIWRYAIARLLETLETKNDWLPAVDAVELAFNVPILQVQLQQRLCEELMSLIGHVKDTPIQELAAIFHLQVPRCCVDPKIIERVVSKFANAPQVDDSEATVLAFEFWAVVSGQNLVDDMRLRLMPRMQSRPRLTWHDLTLNHSELTNAVPLRKSLVVDVNRTGPLLLELIHEIGHAYSLIGPIGWARTAFRVAVDYCELLIAATAPQSSKSDEAKIEPLAQLPSDSLATIVAETQLASSYRSSVLEAVWRPWLEGVAIFLELLCDPKEDLQEIGAVHEAVRSLIDYYDQKPHSEPEELYIKRIEESVAHFENFCSEAIRRHSWFGHKGYLEPGKLRDINVAGYLLIRSLVGRWEKTLGRRLEPIRAVKLLLDATRNGTADALPNLEVDVTDFRKLAITHFRKWLASLARLNREQLESFFESVKPDSPGHRYYWKDGVPRRVLDNSGDVDSMALHLWSKLQETCIKLVSGTETAGDSNDLMAAIVNEYRDTILDLLTHYLNMRSLLPVGRDMARLVFLGEEGRVVVCPRTYMGLNEKNDSESAPRYSIRWFNLDGGAQEASQLRKYCATSGSARLLVTRVIDLVGHPNSPLQRPNMSYTCFMLGDEWHRVTIGDSFVLDNKHASFIKDIKARLQPSPFINSKVQTLESSTFLANRLLNASPTSSIAILAESFDSLACSQEVGWECLATAFGLKSTESIKTSFADSMTQPKTRSAIADYLFLTGRGKSVAPDHPALSCDLAHTAFTTEFSGILPFGGGQ